MPHAIKQLHALRRKGHPQRPQHGALPNVQLTHHAVSGYGGWIFLASALVVFITHTGLLLWTKPVGLLDAMGTAALSAFMAGLATTLLYYLWPLLYVLGFTLFHAQRPTRHQLQSFSIGQKSICLLLFAWGIVFIANHLYSAIAHACRDHHSPHHLWHTDPALIGNGNIAGMVIIVTRVLAFLVPYGLPKTPKPRQKPSKAHRSGDVTFRAIKPFGLWLGRSTGILAAFWHAAGLAAQIDIVLSAEDAAQNLLVFGAIGSGKTTRIMQPVLAQCLDQQCGGLILDVKGDVKHAALTLAQQARRDITFIGPTHTPLNLIGGLPPEVAASFLKSAFLLGGNTHLDSFWVDTATELCRHTLGLLSFLPEHYTLQGLYGYLFDEDVRGHVQNALNPLRVSLSDSEKRYLNAYQRYEDTIFATFDDKVKSGVKATVAQALAPFNHPDLIDAFCQETPESVKMPAVLDGTVYLVDLPLARWGLGSKVAYTFLKLRFFNVMQSRCQHPEWNQDRPTFLMCDEYQELISANKDGLSDLNFWDKSRSSKTLGIISAQSVSSFYAALGNRDLTHAILQNFRQKICFKTEDQVTLEMMDRLAGHARVQRKTIGRTTGGSTRAFTEPTSRHHSDTQSITEVRESVLDATLFRNLAPNQAVALLSLQGRSMDDVLELMPVFV